MVTGIRTGIGRPAVAIFLPHRIPLRRQSAARYPAFRQVQVPMSTRFPLGRPSYDFLGTAHQFIGGRDPPRSAYSLSFDPEHMLAGLVVVQTITGDQLQVF